MTTYWKCTNCGKFFAVRPTSRKSLMGREPHCVFCGKTDTYKSTKKAYYGYYGED